MADFEIDVESGQFLTVVDRLKDFSGIAENDATKRSTKALERFLIDTAKKTVNLKVARIKKGLTVNPRAGQVTISGRAPTLFQFLTPGLQRKLQGSMYREPTKKGLAIRYFKTRPRLTVPGSFLIRGRGGNPLVVRRKNKNDPNSKLEALYGRWLRDLWEVPSIRQGAFEVSTRKYQERFQSTFDKLKRGVF